MQNKFHDVFFFPTANVSENAIIGVGTKIWQNVQVREGASIGKNCNISKDVYIDFNVFIGDNCKIQNGVSIFHGVSIEDDVFVGPCATFTNDKVPRSFNMEWSVTPTFIKKGASIGANATIVCGVIIGEYSMIAAGSVVTKDVAPYTLVLGNPAKFYSYIDKMGNKIDYNPLEVK